MVKFEYLIGSQKESADVNPGMTIFETMQKIGLDFSFPCSGMRRCGKCKVLVQGKLSPVCEVERRMLGDKAPDNMRLACFAKVEGDVEIVLPENKGDDKIMLQFSTLQETLNPNYAGDYGFAVDIGTTTIAYYLFAKDSLWPLACNGELNQQKRYGADVLSRIEYANRNGVAPLSQTIRQQLSASFLHLCGVANISPEKVDKAVITGNTVMLHLLDGLDPHPLAEAPFRMVSNFGKHADWRIDEFPEMEIYLPRCISAYLGADVTCSMLSTGLPDLPDGTLLVDIGTNGEMVLKTNGTLLCCSTAAGPAFEGGAISSGVSARPGAISKVWAEDGRMYYDTIDNLDAVGVCGSGLVDAVSVAVELGIISKRGNIGRGRGAFEIGDSGICLTQKDIRQLQLAKAAIRAGVDTLLEMCGFSVEDIQGLILCGGFGSFLDPGSAAGIGMIPIEIADKFRSSGNGAGAGASIILQNRGKEAESVRIADQSEVVELSYSRLFSKKFVDSMSFPEI